MQFKYPDILYFLFLLLIPILVHLFQLRRFKKEYFTNVQFLKALTIQTRKSSTIKKWLLLITRMLLLAFLIIAFAQPFFKSKDAKNSSNELYIVLDNSYSMQAKGKKGELLKRAVQDLLESTPENTQFSLLTNTETFWNTDIKSIQKELQNLTYSATPFVLENAMSKIKAHKSVFNKDVVIITDGIGLEAKHLKSIAPDFKTLFVIPKAEEKNNIAVDSVYIKQTLDNFYEIGVNLSAYGDNSKSAPIALYNKNKLIAKTIVTFETPKKTIAFTIPKDDFHGYVAIQDKGLDFDNTLFFSILKPKKTNVIAIGEQPKNEFLTRIYTSEEFNFTTTELSKLDYNTIEKQDAILINEVQSIPQALQTTLKSFVEKGGNLIVIPAPNAAKETASFIKQFGALDFSDFQKNTQLITKINFEHPLFSAVFEKKIENFQYPNTKIAAVLKSQYPPILSYQDQNPFLVAIPNSLSSVYVFAAPLNKENSNFQNSPLIVPTFYKMAQNNQKTGVIALQIGTSLPFITDAQLNKDDIVTIKNEKESFIPIQQILSAKVKMNFADFPKTAGNFEIYNGTKAQSNISFNYDRAESNLSTFNNEIISDYKTIESIDSVFNTIKANRTDQQIWKTFVILTLLLLFVELLIQKFVK